MAINFRDQGLRRTFEGMLDRGSISKADVDKLIESTRDGPGLSKTERTDLEKLLHGARDAFEPDARAALETFLGPAAGPAEPVPTSPDFERKSALNLLVDERSAGQAKRVEGDAAQRSGDWWSQVDAPALDASAFAGPMAQAVQVGDETFTQADLTTALSAITGREQDGYVSFGGATSQQPLLDRSALEAIIAAGED